MTALSDEEEEILVAGIVSLSCLSSYSLKDSLSGSGGLTIKDDGECLSLWELEDLENCCLYAVHGSQ